MKAQMGLPDMKLPIQYAFAYPNRLRSDFPRFDFINYPALNFEKPDTETFSCLGIAYDAMRDGGNKACIMNAANEIAVNAFLADKIGFLQIADIVENTIAKSTFIAKPTIEDYVASDAEGRRIAEELIK
jgi:1-deoxy-D-xylulose-5-phosphate reductoisomerase